MSYETIWEKNGVYQRFSGILTENKRDQAIGEVMADPRLDGINYWILDSLAIEEYLPKQIHAEFAAGSIIGASICKKSVSMAFVATNEKHRENILHFIKTIKEHCFWDARLFDDIDTARKWVGKI